MNPALLSSPYVGYSLDTDQKYVGQDRTFTNPTTLTSNEYQPYNYRKQHHGLNNNQLNQTLSVSTNTSGLEYQSASSISDHPYGSDSFLINSPSSLNATQVGGLQTTSSSFNFSGTPKSIPSNASSTDHYPTPHSQYTGSIWNDTAMTNLQHPRPSILHPQVSPPLGYAHTGGLPGPYLSSANRVMDQYPNTYQFSRPFNPLDVHHGHFGKHSRSPNFNQLPMPATYSLGGPFAPLPPQTPGRPDGPPFEETQNIFQLVSTRNQTLTPDISASIQKGFFQVDGKWTCYRRNYFTVACAFSFKNGPPDGPVYLQRHAQPEMVYQYAVSISARTASASSQDSESRQLVQHTPKRDKATESVPGRHLVLPATPQSLQQNGVLPTPSMYPGISHISTGVMGGFDGFGPQGHMSAPTSYTFERIQFQKATANNGKRRAQQQYFHVVVELSVNTARPGAEEKWVIVATKQSHPMVVRGRSPGHYKDNVRRDGQTNMDQDRGSGPGADGGPINLPMPPFGPSSSMDWTPSHRQSHPYGSSYNKYTADADYSPYTASSSDNFTDSPTDSHFQMNDLSATGTASRYNLERSPLSPVSGHNKDLGTGQTLSSYCRKRSFDGSDSTADHGFYHVGHAPDEAMSPHSFDATGRSAAKPVCASS